MPTGLSIAGQVNYLAANSISPAFHMGNPGEETQRVGTYCGHNVEIFNGRSLEETPSLEKEGFELLHHHSVDVDFLSDQAVKTDYYPQIQALMRDRLGCEEVVIFDHTVRTSAIGDAQRKPASHVHNDYTPASAIQRLVDITGGGEAIKKLRQRFVQINLWRPIWNTVQEMPLALVDARTVATQDYVKADIHYSDRVGEILEVKYNAQHRWIYFPDMDPSEAILFRGFDSGDQISHPYTPHTAFALPDTDRPSVPRNSIELRALAFFSQP